MNIDPAYRLRELEYALTHSGVSMLVTARGFRRDGLCGHAARAHAGTDGERGRSQILAERLPALRHVVYLRRRRGTGSGSPGSEFLDPRQSDTPRASSRRVKRRWNSTTRSTFGHLPGPRGRRKVRRSRTSDHTEQRLHRRRSAALYGARQDLRAGPVLSLLRLRAGEPRAGITRAAAVVIPGESFDPDATLRAIEAERARRPSMGCRRCSSRSSTIPASAASSSTRCARASSWLALPVRSTSCVRSSAACTCTADHHRLRS